MPAGHGDENCGTVEKALAKKRQTFSKDLALALDEDEAASRKEPGMIVGLDFDPFVNAQDTPDKCITGSVKQKGQSNTYLVDVFAFWQGKKDKKPCCVAEVVRSGDKWAIANIHYPNSDIKENENLLSILKVLKKDRQKGTQ